MLLFIPFLNSFLLAKLQLLTLLSSKTNYYMISKQFIITCLLTLLILTGCRQQKKENSIDSASALPIGEELKPSVDSTLHTAALNGNIQAIIAFIAQGVKPDAEDTDGRTALMYASYNGYTNVVRELITMGADVNKCDKYGRAPLLFASSGPYPETVKVLLDNRADPNIADTEERFTALMYASAEGHIDNVRILLAYNSDPSLKDVDGDSAITFAIRNGHTDIANLLRSYAQMQDKLKKSN